VVTPALAAVALGAGLLIRPAIERRLAERLVSEGRRHGLIVATEEVHVGLITPVTLGRLTITRPGRFRIATPRLRVGLAPWGHGLAGVAWRVRTDRVALSLPAGVELAVAPSVWDLRPAYEGRRLIRRRAGERLDVEWMRGQGQGAVRILAEDVQLSGFLEVRRGRAALDDLGVVSGELRVERQADGRLRVAAEGRGRGMRFATIAQATEAADAVAGPPHASAGSLPIDAELQLTAFVSPDSADVEIEQCRLAGGGATLTVRGTVRHVPDDPELNIHFTVERVDFGRVLATAGLELPSGVAHFGSAALDLDVRGHARDPRSLVVKQRVDFTPPEAPIPALERLRAPFLQEVRPSHGRPRLLLVGPESADFIALVDVPPLFVRALLLSEDAGFYGHHGLDFAEMSVALATNWVRGTPARGASTITQQLAKNLFLTRQKSVSRKLSEAALALLLDGTLGKQRVLEIYLNVIEWGPDIYGLRSASRHYFGKEPQELTIKEAAFLIALIPGPIKYQRSFASGAPSPAFENLMAGVLVKLRSVDAIDEDQYEAALAEALLIRTNGTDLAPMTDNGVSE
jgi:hypothetical protein